MSTKPKYTNHTIIAQSRLFSIEQFELHFANGEHRTYERIKGSNRGSVLIVPLLDNETVLLIREYGAAIERYELTLPKGLCDPGESFCAAANRELMEEAGYGAHDLQIIKEMTLSPSYFSATTHIVLAQNLYPKRLPGDEPEAITVVPWKLNQLSELIQRDDFTESRSIAALYLVQNMVKSGHF